LRVRVSVMVLRDARSGRFSSSAAAPCETRTHGLSPRIDVYAPVRMHRLSITSEMWGDRSKGRMSGRMRPRIHSLSLGMASSRRIVAGDCQTAAVTPPAAWEPATSLTRSACRLPLSPSRTRWPRWGLTRGVPTPSFCGDSRHAADVDDATTARAFSGVVDRQRRSAGQRRLCPFALGGTTIARACGGGDVLLLSLELSAARGRRSVRRRARSAAARCRASSALRAPFGDNTSR